ncbi:MAG: ATP-binding protein [Treponema sp.]|nr:ATP-binding protein [Treponema sp.]
MLRRRRFGRKSAAGTTELTRKDCEAGSYYLYRISELIAEEDNNDFHAPQARLFFKFVDKMNRREAVSKFLAEKVEKLVELGELTPIPPLDQLSDTQSEFRHKRISSFDYSDIPYEFEEDHDIDRQMPSNELKLDTDMVNLYRIIHTISGEDNFFCRLVANFLLRKNPVADFAPIEKIPSHIQKALNDNSSIRFIMDSVELKKEESDFLLFSYRCSLMAALHNLLNELSADLAMECRISILGITRREYNSLTKSNAALRSFGFIDDDGDIEDDIVECIANQSLDSFFSDLVKEADCSNAYPLDTFQINKNAGTIIEKMLAGNENISILLYGKPGSGKTEYAKSLAKKLGLKALVFKNEAELSQNGKNSKNVLCRLNLLLSINRQDTLLIIDEADTLLKTKSVSFLGMEIASPEKGTVNKMLEESRNKIVWIVNFTNQIDESTLRRFNFSYKFESMSKDQLRSITSSKLDPLHLEDSTNSEILSLMEKFSITGASVDNVVKTIKSLEGAENSELLDCVQTILKENSLLISGKAKMRESVTKSYDLKALNASMDPEKIVRMIENARKFAEKNRTNENGIRILCYGISGTGKTEFARYIAERLGKKILLKRASDILGMYVGQTEKSIRDAFEEASRTDSILLFDEADSFFADRNSAHHSWERTQVNEFLTQMEEFDGIMICTTNLKKIMDSAMNRRFHMIVEFKPLDHDGIRRMLERYFGGYEFTESQISRLERRSSVTPGDFGVLSNKMRFMDEADLSADFITEELCRIQDEKNNEGGNKIGFIE